ncbi:MAG: LptA/OstA family protein [Paracoccaceae bacterium]|nr:LptA/OstA family protein [Paracoccaceae bacterium]
MRFFVTIFRVLALTLAALLPGAAIAQGANVALGGLAFDNSAPIEVSADNLSVDPEDGSAVFEGNVLVAQGDLRLAANLIRVEYATDAEGNQTPSIGRVSATGGVTFVNGADAAEATEAVYSVEESSLVMTGDVLLTQGENVVAGDRLLVDLAAGTGRIEGGVRTVFQTGGN